MMFGLARLLARSDLRPQSPANPRTYPLHSNTWRALAIMSCEVAYPILEVTGWQALEEESLGTKQKIWLVDDQKQEWLFKFPRPGTGEHWAERVVAAVATHLNVPHAVVELARRASDPGSVALNFAGDRTKSALLLGNYILSRVPGYESTKKKPKLHSVELVLRALSQPRFRPPSGCPAAPWLRTAADALAGYLMLDALVGNTDRHHENWGLLVRPDPQPPGHLSVELAPTFDHASSLGREIDDQRRDRLLDEADRRVTVETYCDRGPSPLFRMGGAPKPLTVRAAFQRALQVLPAASQGWLGQLAVVDPGVLRQCVDDLPQEVASPSAVRFAKAMLDCNRRFLLDLRAP